LSKKLAKADRLAVVGRMAAEIAHEIRNPIAAMRLRAENALAKPGEHHKAALDFILPEIRRLDDMLERLLAVTRLASATPVDTLASALAAGTQLNKADHDAAVVPAAV
jgi:hypothetical protein